MATKIWNNWKIEDGDYVANCDSLPKNPLFENAKQKVAFSVGFAVFCVTIVVLIAI
jgi:predicted lipoprotein